MTDNGNLLISEKLLALNSGSFTETTALCEEIIRSLSNQKATAIEISQLIWLRLHGNMYSAPFDVQSVLCSFLMIQYFLQNRQHRQFGSACTDICQQMYQYGIIEMVDEVYKHSNIQSDQMDILHKWLLSQESIASDFAGSCTTFKLLIDKFIASAAGKSLPSHQMKKRHRLFEYLEKVSPMVPEGMERKMFDLVESLFEVLHTEKGFQELVYLCTEIERLSTSHITYPFGREKGIHSSWNEASTSMDIEESLSSFEGEVIRFEKPKNLSQHEQFIGKWATSIIPSYEMLSVLPKSPTAKISEEISKSNGYCQPFSSSSEWRKGRSR